MTFSGRVEAYCAARETCCDDVDRGRGPADAAVAVPRRPGASRCPSRPRPTSRAAPTRSRSACRARTTATPPYTVTIDPDGGGEQPPSNGATEPAELVPPKRIDAARDRATSSTRRTRSAAPTTPVDQRRRSRTRSAAALTSYRVVALGRWDADVGADRGLDGRLHRPNGQYSLTLAEDVVGAVELVAHAVRRRTSSRPTLHVCERRADRRRQRNLAQPTGLGSRADVDDPDQGPRRRRRGQAGRAARA